MTYRDSLRIKNKQFLKNDGFYTIRYHAPGQEYDGWYLTVHDAPDETLLTDARDEESVYTCQHRPCANNNIWQIKKKAFSSDDSCTLTLFDNYQSNYQPNGFSDGGLRLAAHQSFNRDFLEGMTRVMVHLFKPGFWNFVPTEVENIYKIRVRKQTNGQFPAQNGYYISPNLSPNAVRSEGYCKSIGGYFVDFSISVGLSDKDHSYWMLEKCEICTEKVLLLNGKEDFEKMKPIFQRQKPEWYATDKWWSDDDSSYVQYVKSCNV